MTYWYRKRLDLISVGFVLLLCLTMGALAKEGEFKYKSKKTLMGNYEPYMVSPDQRAVVGIVRTDNLRFKPGIYVNNQEGKKYDEVLYQSVTFSPDSQKIAYYARVKTDWILVIGSDEIKLITGAKTAPFFSPDSKHYGAILFDQNGYFVFQDGQIGKSYRNISGYRFSDDSSQLAYSAQLSDGKWVVVVNGQESQACEAIKWFQFSPDSKRLAFCVKQNEKEVMIVDGIKGKEYDYISVEDCFFNTDNNQLIYAARSGQQWAVVTEGKESLAPGPITANSLVAGKRVAYRAVVGAKEIAVIDGKNGPGYDKVRFLMFSPDYSRVIYCAQQDNFWFLVEDGQESLHYELIGKPIFSSDGCHLAYKIKQGSFYYMVIDGVVQAPYTEIDGFVFGPTGKESAYVVTSDKKKLMVRNGVAESNKGFAEIILDTITFSPDGRHLAYVAHYKGSLEAAVVDGKARSNNDRILGRIIFDEPNKFRFLTYDLVPIYNQYVMTYVRYCWQVETVITDK